MELSNIINIVILFVLLLLTLGFVFYKRIVGVSIFFIKLLFPLSLILACSTLFIPAFYSNIVQESFSTTVLAKDLKSVDKTLTQVSRFQISINNSLNSLLNTGNQESLEQYESNIYGQIVDFLTGALRIALLLLSIILLVFALYIRYSFAGAFETQNLQKQIDELKKEVQNLKNEKSINY